MCVSDWVGVSLTFEPLRQHDGQRGADLPGEPDVVVPLFLRDGLCAPGGHVLLAGHVQVGPVLRVVPRQQPLDLRRLPEPRPSESVRAERAVQGRGGTGGQLSRAGRGGTGRAERARAGWDMEDSSVGDTVGKC